VSVARSLIALASLSAALLAAPATAQQPKMARVGFLGLTAEGAPVSMARVEAFRTGMRERGYVEGRNLQIEFRWANNNYELLPGLAEELVKAKVNVLVTYSTPGAMAAKRATRTVPIVLASVGDPTATGIVANLARPAGNITGLSILTPDEMAKRMELLKDALPAVRRVGLLINPDNLNAKPSAARAQQAAAKLQLELHVAEARSVADFEPVFAALVEKGMHALAVYEDPIFTAEAKKLVALALRHRVPTIGQVSFAEAGGLIGNGANQTELFRRAAGYVDQILRGAKPGELPIQQPARFELVVNRTTAIALGVTLPQSVLFRADRIIE